MKKAIGIYAVILLAVLIILSVLGLKGSYSLERKVWRLQKDFVEVAKDYQSVPNNVIDKVIEKHKKLIAQNPGKPLLRGTYFAVGSLYILQKKYDLARKEFTGILDIYKDPEVQAEALFGIGKTYEMEGKWDQAMAFYTRTNAEYPLTKMGMISLGYIGHYYRKANDFQNAVASYDKAITFYRRIAKEQADKGWGLDALNLISDCYLAQNRWSEALTNFEQILMEYAGQGKLLPVQVQILVKRINALAIREMNSYDAAVAVYQKFVNTYPDNPLTPSLKVLIQQLTSVKNTAPQVIK